MLVKKSPPPQPDNYRVIFLNSYIYTKIDAEDFTAVNRFHWRPKHSGKNVYAVRRFVRYGKYHEIRLHRFLMNSVPGEEPHHINHDTLDNRKSNLVNVPHDAHPHIKHLF